MARFRAIAAGLLGPLLLYVLTCIGLVFWVLDPPSSSFPSYPCDANGEDEVLASFDRAAPSSEDERFFFGLATAPAHVEDELDDSWLEFARRGEGRVRAWHNVAAPEQRLRFWTAPEAELDMAKGAGVSVFRMGVDWGRLVPYEPINGTEAAASPGAASHYRRILEAVRARGLRVMLTLFHHSLPKWALSYGGWADPRTVAYFGEFASYAQRQFGDLVDYWVTFNEPHIFVLLSHCFGAWPPGVKLSSFELFICTMTPLGAFRRAMGAITDAHNLAYEVLHRGGGGAPTPVRVGVAHHVGAIRPYGLLDAPLIVVSKWFTLYSWIDSIVQRLDFCGLNFYGQEAISLAGLMLVPDEEYSEAGRGVYPDGLYQLLVAFHARYKPTRPRLTYIITENGFADARDILRRPYLVEHLLALHAALEAGVPVEGYIHWTVADNWEWADGYCPKFGLVDVDRANNLTRYPRPSYYLYKEIVEKRVVTRGQRAREWETLQSQVRQGETRPFCRAADRHGRMGDQGLDVPVMRPFSDRDWRVGMYKPHGFWTLSKRSLEVAWILLSDIFGGSSYLHELQGSDEL